MICKYPVQNKIATAARGFVCGQPATVGTVVNFNNQLIDTALCLKHSIENAVNKLIGSLKPHQYTDEEIEYLGKYGYTRANAG